MRRGLSERQHVALTLPFIERVCSDEVVHRRRIEARVRGIAGMPEVTWDHVEERRAEYKPWAKNPMTIDTSLEPIEFTIGRVLALVDED